MSRIRQDCGNPLFAAGLALGLMLAPGPVGLGGLRADEPTRAEIRRLIQQLGSNRFEEREEASRKLEAIGEPAWNALRQAAASSGDAEVRQRAGRLASLIRGQMFQEVRRLEGHEGQVSCVAITRDGKRALTGGLDMTLRLWDLQTGQELRCFKDQPGGVWAVAFSRDGKRALSSAGMRQIDGSWVNGSDFSIRLWDLETGKEVRRLVGHTGEVRSIAWSADGKLALSTGWDKIVRLWDVETGNEIRRLEGHTASTRWVTFSPDGRRALSSGLDITARLWDVATGKELRRFEGHTDDVLSVTFLPDGKRALSAGADRTLRLWNVDTGQEIRRLEGHQTVIWNVSVSADGKHALSASGTRSHGNSFYSPAGFEYEMVLWDLETGETIHRYAGHTNCVMAAQFLPGGKTVLSAGGDGTVRIWKLPQLARD